MDSRHTHTHTLLLTQSQAKSLHISSYSLHSTKKRLKCHKCSCSHRGQWQLSKLLMLPSLLPVPYHSHFLLISLTLLTLSFLHPLFSPVFLSLSVLLLTLFLLPFSLICLFPVSSICTMHINYSEAVYWFLQLIQSEQSSALMGSCCTCYRLQHTLQTMEGIDRGSRGDSWGGGRMWGRDKYSEPTQTNRIKVREAKMFSCFSPLSWGAVTDMLILVRCCHTVTHMHTCMIRQHNQHLSGGERGKKTNKKNPKTVSSDFQLAYMGGA